MHMARKLDIDKRKRILEGAFMAFGKYGYRNTSIKDIAKMASIAPGSVYTYFSDKEELFRCTVDEGLNMFNMEVKRIIQLPESFEIRLIKVIDFGYDLLKTVYPIFRGMFEEANRLDLFRKNVANLCHSFEELFMEGKKQGIVDIPDDKELRTFFVQVIISGILFSTSIIPPDMLDKSIEEMKQKTKKGLIQTILFKKLVLT
ncbi:MAG: TetR/AcrR family transcriptional regulator [Spirochaetales bacterium]|nr:MAG: TetR/AcrR family transcriptional regulator [Spirochaetales bacterium]